MKKLYLLVAVMLLTGCAGLLAPDFDNHEYGNLALLNTHAEYAIKECDTGIVYNRLHAMKFKSATLVTYAEHIPDNHEITQMARIIDNDIQEMLDRKDMSEVFCELKLKQLLIKLNQALISVGALN